MRPRIFLTALAVLLAPAAFAEAPEALRDHLPPPSITEHSIDIGGHALAFKATASALPVKDAQSGETIAEIAALAFTVEAKGACRPVVFAFNGGPGAGSAWLDLGAAGPWRLPLGGATPSTPPRLVDNAESWLEFTDLVFLDPPGTGFAPTPANEGVRKRMWSVDGDVGALAVAIRRWIAQEHRQACGKYLLGESYGGFRAPKIAHVLQERENIGVDGLILLSPALDFSWIDGRDTPLLDAARLPSLAASHLHAKDRMALRDAEEYARGDYLVDLLRGPSDAAALDRIVNRLTGLIGLPPERLRRLGGHIRASDWTRDSDPSGRSIASSYDGAVRGLSPDPSRAPHEWSDPVLDGLRAPLAEAMTRLSAEKLKWAPDARYEILNDRIAESWDWGGDRRGQEALSDLRRVMALDPRVKAIVAHGLDDLVTPYFGTRLLLDGSETVGAADRIEFLALPGGHMFYAEDVSRAALRDTARKLIEAK